MVTYGASAPAKGVAKEQKNTAEGAKKTTKSGTKSNKED